MATTLGKTALREAKATGYATVRILGKTTGRNITV